MAIQNIKCNGIIGFFFGHSFKPRYTQGTTKVYSSHSEVIQAMTAAYMNANYRKDTDYVIAKRGITAVENLGLSGKAQSDGTYVKDVCARCGAEVIHVPVNMNAERRLEPEL